MSMLGHTQLEAEASKHARKAESRAQEVDISGNEGDFRRGVLHALLAIYYQTAANAELTTVRAD